VGAAALDGVEEDKPFLVAHLFEGALQICTKGELPQVDAIIVPVECSVLQ
jgi:hypothetical protein